MNIKINYRGKRMLIKNVKRCRSSFSKLRGLMFRKNPEPLLLVFSKPVKTKIHSFFVFQKFLAVWMRKAKVVDMKIVEPWKLGVAPQRKFDALLEIPLESN